MPSAVDQVAKLTRGGLTQNYFKHEKLKWVLEHVLKIGSLALSPPKRKFSLKFTVFFKINLGTAKLDSEAFNDALDVELGHKQEGIYFLENNFVFKNVVRTIK